MASCVRNIQTKNCQNPIISFRVTVKNVGDAFFETVYIGELLACCCSLCEKAPHFAVFALGGDRFKTQVTRLPATIYWIVMTRLGTPFYLITTRRECRLAQRRRTARPLRLSENA